MERITETCVAKTDSDVVKMNHNSDKYVCARYKLIIIVKYYKGLLGRCQNESQ